MKLPIDIDTVKGFLDPAEGRALYDAVLMQAGDAADAPPAGERAALFPALEIGSYCGKSTIYLGTACQKAGGILIAVDHHYGSEENQPGEEYFDPDLADAETGGMNSLAHFRKNINRAGLQDIVIPVLAPSLQAAKIINAPLSFVFIDGGHSMQAAFNDYRLWTPKLMHGGVLAIHDVFPDPSDGGRPPYEIYKMALASQLFEEIAAVKSLRLLRKK